MATRTPPPPRPGTHSPAFTLIELLVTIAIIATLAGLLLGVTDHMRALGAQTACVNNLRQWGVAMTMYSAEHGSSIPRRGQGIQPVTRLDRPEDWFNRLPPYMDMPSYADQVANGHPARPGDKTVFVCPAAKVTGNYPNFICYGMNIYLSPWIRPEEHRILELPEIHQLAFMADAPGGWASTVPSREAYSVQARHNGRANVVFVDGHVQSFDGDYLGCGTGTVERPDVRWQTLSGGVNLPFNP